MGVSIAPDDIFQDRIYQLSNNIECVQKFIDDWLVVTKGSYEEHLNQLDAVFAQLSSVGLKCKIIKCFFCQPEIKYLGCIITKEGVKPQPKKVQAILDMQRSTNKTEVRHFLGMVQFYCDLWLRSSEILLPITELTKGAKKGPITWTPTCEAAFAHEDEAAHCKGNAPSISRFR